MKITGQSKPTPPRGLSPEARRWWHALVQEYAIEDHAGLLLLGQAMQAFDRAQEAKKLIDTEGLTVVDRFGQHKAHPAATVERDSRAAMISALRALNLDLEPLRDRPGRPGGR